MITSQTEVKFTVEVSQIPTQSKLVAEHKAREAYIMELLRHHDISAGRVAELLGIDRWQLSDLMAIYQISPFPEYGQEELAQEVALSRALIDKK